MWFCQLFSKHLNRDMPIRLPLADPFCDSLESWDVFTCKGNLVCDQHCCTNSGRCLRSETQALPAKPLDKPRLLSHTLRAVKAETLLVFHLPFLGDDTWNTSKQEKWKKECNSLNSWLSPGAEKASKQQWFQEKIRVNGHNEWLFSRSQSHSIVWFGRNLERPFKSNSLPWHCSQDKVANHLHVRDTHSFFGPPHTKNTILLYI